MMSVMKNKFIVAAIVLFVLRILAGRLVGVIFIPFADGDDALMVRYSYIEDHFLYQLQTTVNVMDKEMGFPLFLSLLKNTGIAYPDAISFLWLLSAITFTILFVTLTKVRRNEILLLIYSIVLFTPISFSWVGLRVYRNSALVPFYFLILTLILWLFVIYWKKLELTFKQRILFGVVFGILFSWTYFMKEDGIWLLMILIAVIAVCLIHKIFFESQPVKEKFYHVLILFLPLAIFFSCQTAYKAVNYHFFGVYETNNRTNGELGKFLANVYKIKSDDRNGSIWAPADAILKAFDASPTLKQNDKLRNAVIDPPDWYDWYNGGKNIFENPIHGDFFSWIMLSALHDSGTCDSPASQEIYLRQVNLELAEAFENGTLKKDDKFQITSSMGGRTFSEILELKNYVATTYLTHIVLLYYDLPQIINPHILESRLYFDGNEPSEELISRYADIIQRACEVTNMNLLEKNEHFDSANRFVTTIILIYRILNCVTFIAAFIGIILAVRKIICTSVKEYYDEAIIAVIAEGSLLLSAVYAVAISWFCQFLIDLDNLTFYGIGMVPMLTIFEIFGSYLFLRLWKKI